MIIRMRVLLGSPMLQGALGATLVVVAWFAGSTMLPRAEASDPQARPLWGTDFLPVAPVVGPAPLRAGFLDMSYVDLHDEGTVNHWEWDFGDGSPTRVCFGSQCVPHYQVAYDYDLPGMYDVRLLTGGTMEGIARRPSLVRTYDRTATQSDIAGFWLRDGYLVLLSPSAEWPAFEAVAEAIGVRGIYFVGETQVERLAVGADGLHERLQGLPWAVAQVTVELP